MPDMKHVRNVQCSLLVVSLLTAGIVSAAQDIHITELEQFTENRGWNEAGLSPVYQLLVTATVVPSGYPTLVFVEQKGVRQPLSRLRVPFGHPSSRGGAPVDWPVDRRQ